MEKSELGESITSSTDCINHRMTGNRRSLSPNINRPDLSIGDCPHDWDGVKKAKVSTFELST